MNRLLSIRRVLPIAIFAAAVGSCSGGDPVSPSAGVPTALVSVSGDGQAAPVSTALAQDFVVRVDDNAGNPVAGVTVTWAVTAGGGSIAPASDPTDASGLSQARLTVGSAAGTNTATATVAGLGSVTFNASGTSDGGGGGATPSNITFRTIDAGSYHTCAITPKELSYCWGFNQDGELGTGSTATSMAPASVSGGLSFRQVSGGKYHSCAITLSGDGYCWGSNLEGQLGQQVDLRSTTPVLNSRAITFGSISVGRAHTCGLTLIGVAFCWGSNIAGQLGFVTQTTSVDTAGYVGRSPLFQRIASGGFHNCGLDLADQAWCWGFNDQGQLGNGTTATILPDTAAAALDWVIPVSGGIAFDSITAGYKHTCALTAAGVAYCWGDNTYGQLGDGTTTRSVAPVPVAGGLTFISLSAGFYHTCGIATGGAAYCWGRNTPNAVQESVGGQLGDGTTTDRTAPTAVTGSLSFQSLSAGETTTCGVTTSSLAYCWGDNEYGQLGTGNSTSSQIPVKIINQP
ncbi:MAG: Ig-like domain-containing protein [Gemmatimonadales bacterium]